jgi:hypothetical protein
VKITVKLQEYGRKNSNPVATQLPGSGNLARKKSVLRAADAVKAVDEVVLAWAAPPPEKQPTIIAAAASGGASRRLIDRTFMRGSPASVVGPHRGADLAIRPAGDDGAICR